MGSEIVLSTEVLLLLAYVKELKELMVGVDTSDPLCADINDRIKVLLTRAEASLFKDIEESK